MPYGYYDYMENYYENYYQTYYENYYAYYWQYTKWPAIYANQTNGTYNGTYPPSPYVYDNRYQYSSIYNMGVLTPFLMAFILLMLIASFATFILMCYQLYKHQKNAKKSEMKRGVVVLTMVCMVCHLVQNFIDPLTYYTWFIEYAPETNYNYYLAYNTFWAVAKVSLYILFIYRYYLIFQASRMLTSHYKRNQSITFGLFAAAIVAQLLSYLGFFIFSYDFVDFSHLGRYDSTRAWLASCWFFLCLDVVLIGVIAYLLTKSILKMIITIQGNDDNPINLQMRTKQSMDSQPTGVTVSGNTNTKIEKELVGYMMNQVNTNNEASVGGGSIGPTASVGDSHGDGSGDGNDGGGGGGGGTEMSATDTAATLATDTGADGPPTGATELHAARSTSDATPSARRWKSTESSMGGETSLSMRTLKSNKSDARQLQLIHTTTRILLTSFVAMMSSFIWQFLWLVAYELENWDLLWFAYTWSLDAVINMVCIYLSMSFAKAHYKWLCNDIFRCHQCCLRCVQRQIVSGVERKRLREKRAVSQL